MRRDERRSWYSNHLATAVTSLFVSGIMAFSAMAYGFTQTTIENEITLMQQTAILDSRLGNHIESYNESMKLLREDTKWIKDNLQKVIISTAILESIEE